MDQRTPLQLHLFIPEFFAEAIVLDQDWCQYLLKYPDEAVTVYNAGYPVVCWLVPTFYKIDTEPPQLP
jgi:hypothetical protein